MSEHLPPGAGRGMKTTTLQLETRKAKGLAPQAPRAEFTNRLKRCRKLMKTHGFDGLLVYGSPFEPSWIRYLANVIHPFILSQSYFVLPRKGEPVLLIDFPVFFPSVKQMTWVKDIRTYSYVEFSTQYEDNVKLFRDLLKELKLNKGRIGLCMLDMPATHYKALTKAAPKAAFEDATAMLWELIEDKSPFDCTMIRKAAWIADRTMETVIGKSAAGRTEYEIGLAAEATALSHGAEFGTGSTVRTHLYMNTGSEILSNFRPYKYTGRKLKKGDLFCVDLSVCYNGYYADFCRTICVGKPTPKQQRLFDTVEEIHFALFESLKPGVRGGDLWDLGCKIAHRAGYRNLNAWFGHGTGLIISEPPFLAAGETRTIKAGTFVNIEPGIFLPKTVGSVDIEDATFITAKGAEWVTKCDRSLHIV